MATPETAIAPRSAWTACRHCLRANLIPGVVIQVIALLVIAAYWWLPAALPWFTAVSDAKTAGGLGYSAAATAIAGGLVPWLVMIATGRIDAKQRWRQLAFYLVFFGWKGVEVDLLYRLQGSWFGDGRDATTLTLKVVVDQFIYNPLWAAWTGALLFRWRDGGLTRAAWRDAWPGLWRVDFPAMLVTTWVVWIPAVTVIYAMPPALQIPLFNLVLCFFVLVATLVASKRATPTEPANETHRA